MKIGMRPLWRMARLWAIRLIRLSEYRLQGSKATFRNFPLTCSGQRNYGNSEFIGMWTLRNAPAGGKPGAFYCEISPTSLGAFPKIRPIM